MFELMRRMTHREYALWERRYHEREPSQTDRYLMRLMSVVMASQGIDTDEEKYRIKYEAVEQKFDSEGSRRKWLAALGVEHGREAHRSYRDIGPPGDSSDN